MDDNDISVMHKLTQYCGGAYPPRICLNTHPELGDIYAQCLARTGKPGGTMVYAVAGRRAPHRGVLPGSDFNLGIDCVLLGIQWLERYTDYKRILVTAALTQGV